MRTVWSSDKFDHKLAMLFESFEGREQELQQRLSAAIKLLLDGSRVETHKHRPSGPTGEVPLIDDFVIVFSAQRTHWGPDYVDISEADHIDLLSIEQDPQ